MDGGVGTATEAQQDLMQANRAATASPQQLVSGTLSSVASDPFLLGDQGHAGGQSASAQSVLKSDFAQKYRRPLGEFYFLLNNLNLEILLKRILLYNFNYL